MDKPQEELSWRTSSFCNNTACVEVAVTADSVAIRDSKNPSQGIQVYSGIEWREFVAGVKNGEFDIQ